jgi:hypothetical protein
MLDTKVVKESRGNYDANLRKSAKVELFSAVINFSKRRLKRIPRAIS